MKQAVTTPIPTPTSHTVDAGGPASTALTPFTAGGHDTVLVLTFGQFSIGDAIRHLLDRTGRAHVTIATWTAAAAEIEHAHKLLTDDRITGMRWVVDRSFQTRQPQYCRALVDRFGADAIRATRTHAKFVVIRGADEAVSILTSCNLNANARLETLLVTRDPATADWLTGVVDEIWRTSPAGDLSFGDLPSTPPPPGGGPVVTGSRPAVGRVVPGR